MKKHRFLFLFLFLLGSCRKEIQPQDVTSFMPDLNISLQGLDTDLTYHLEKGNNKFYESNTLKVLNYIYSTRKVNTKNYEFASRDISYLNWNKEKEILFVNFGSSQKCYAGYSVFLEVSEDKIKLFSREKINLDKLAWWDFYRQRFKEETDKSKIAKHLEEDLYTNSCKP